MRVQGASDVGARVTSENQYFGSPVETSYASGSKKTQVAGDNQQYRPQPVNNHRPVGRCSPIINESHQTQEHENSHFHNNKPHKNCQSFPSSMPSPPVQNEKYNTSSSPQNFPSSNQSSKFESDPKQNSASQNPSNHATKSVQVVQLVQSTCGQTYFVVQN